ncbi:MAG: hypothetical protein IPO86_13655 [Saprospiraceae bacterium]|nr:hypothetical protein [Saprospiraceae bacterium]
MMLIPVKPLPRALDDWGFYAHKLINRMAVFTLPEDLIEFYKSNLDYITSHAIDPDKRRYAVKGEAVRHYIDLDHWNVDSSSVLNKDFAISLIKNSHFYYVYEGIKCLVFDTSKAMNDTLYYTQNIKNIKLIFTTGVHIHDFRKGFLFATLPYYDTEHWNVPLDSFHNLFLADSKEEFIEIEDRFTAHGILPYHLESSYHQLVNAFESKNVNRILRLSADIGHYMGDAHVPLHTTKNYNGQLTNQVGIHAFWESRIPELFAESEFDFVIGRAQYFSDIKSFIWQIIHDSHSGVFKVLNIEKTLSKQIPADKQYCYDERLGVISKIQCKDYAYLYHKELDQQVETRMRDCILNLGSLWMSAWVEAGQPDLSVVNLNRQEQELIKEDSTLHKPKREVIVREHE